MRFTRAAKVAAFPLTALILVALVACQGPVGPAGPAVTGPDGPSGPSGPSGGQGLPGKPGDSPLSTVTAMDNSVVYVNDITSLTAPTKVGLPATIDVSLFFSGGIGTKTYEAAPLVYMLNTVPMGGAAATTYTLTKTGLTASPPTIVVALKAPTVYSHVVTSDQLTEKAAVIAITATDASGERKTANVRVLGNKAR